MRLRNRVVKALALAFLSGCGAGDLDSNEAEGVDEPMPRRDSAIPTLEEFIESVHQKIRIGDTEVDAYVVEGDMLLSYETLVDYYETVMLPVQEKSVGVLVDNSTPADPGPVPVFLKRPGFPAVVRYCFDTTWSAAQKSQAQTAINGAAAVWEAVAGIDLRYVSALDGASCTAQQAGKDIRVTRFSGVAQGSFPKEANQILGLPSPPPSRRVLLHEIGHIFGLAHEQFHSQSGLNCPVVLPNVPRVIRYSNLTPQWDPASVMQYYNNGVAGCLSGGDAGPGTLSAGDIAGMQALYGPAN